MKSQTVSGNLGPGAMLQRKREALGWSVSQVAESLRLSRAQIEAIETDDFAALPGRTYVLGYWKNYSRLLDIPFDDVIAANKVKLNEANAGISLSNEYRDHRVKGDRTSRRAAVLIGLLLVGFLAAVWYFKNNGRELERFALSSSTKQAPRVASEGGFPAAQSETTTGENATSDTVSAAETPRQVTGAPSNGGTGERPSKTQAAGTLPATAPQPNLDPVQAAPQKESVPVASDKLAPNIEQSDPSAEVAAKPRPQSQLQTQTVVEADSVSSEAGGSESGTAPAEAAQAPETEMQAEETPEVAAPEAPLDLDSWTVSDTGNAVASESAERAQRKSQAVAEVAAEERTVQESAPKSQPTKPASQVQRRNPDQLTVTAFKKTWLDVRDADNKRLVNRTVSRGTVLQLKGKPPFSVFVGTPDGVHVVYGGRVVRYQADSSKKFARFSVGGR